MDDVTEPPITDLALPDADYLDYDEVIAAIDALSALDRARLDRLELRHLGGTDYVEGDLLHEAVCSAILEDKKCPRTTPFIAFLAQSMRNIAGRQRKKLRRQVPIDGGATRDDDSDDFDIEDDSPGAEVQIIRAENDKRAAEVWATLEPHYRGDEEMQLMLLGWEESMRGKELREFVGVTQERLDYIAKRVRRIAAKHYPKGWPL
ncbi:sigma-70 family RNA polymerase sigma factor [Bradyrhizobium erythrophlei]|uniref:DNA-directed RNA polymerase specialized sigma subunit, sigma24 family n=1 Tax=Bradyrhizobium erythrophlei TaxID=1437360 RepID=A0A1M5YNI8_9BRAD|nr:sigma-70 family RNA polymerase sigma factor [Bradyrhizobium erythrophlei]SHI13667.1 DNA-directed RNA polymerase specialized sigma subunit, sigma24 family [Bradyrhizobium erythrophlei]